MHTLTVFCQLERMTDTGAITVIQLLADFASDCGTNDGAHDDCDDAARAIADLRTHGSPDDAADHRADRVAIALTLDDPVVVLPLAACVAHVVGVVLLAPAVSGRV